MMFVYYSNQAKKFLKSLDKSSIIRILNKIEFLQENPSPPNSKTIKGVKERLFRVRVGDFRILYEVDFKKAIIGIVKIDKRSRVYSRD
ncbi:type II toxin-antitoxin system RelE/ParE family toxin [Candidatus Woesearchaeota archaeon]|nr:MAG: type II toxin-antitoxin system RelE/ParE family toxin [Candidatus Woesearchaeota archaeon]